MDYELYVHIPFCRQKCFYCDFPSWAGRERYMETYTEALCCEIAAQGSRFASAGRAVTVYVGGGTPTALPQALLLRVLQAIREHFHLAAEAEFTVEANPGTVDGPYLTALRESGANRLSLGVQSFDDGLLRRIGRIHTAAAARQAFGLARAAGFANVSLDLMYGLPGQTLAGLAASVAAAVALAPEHISIYGLQLEAGTVFARQQEQGRLTLPDEAAAEAMYDYMTAELPRCGYQRYEISNFARPGYESRHNLGYWQDVPYLGLGAAAHSYWQGQRRENTADIAVYIRQVMAGESPSREEEPATRSIQLEEFCFLALRTVRGIDRAAFQAKFGCTLESVYAAVLQDMQAKGLLVVDEAGARLTERGMKYGNVVFGAFLL